MHRSKGSVGLGWAAPGSAQLIEARLISEVRHRRLPHGKQTERDRGAAGRHPRRRHTSITQKGHLILLPLMPRPALSRLATTTNPGRRTSYPHVNTTTANQTPWQQPQSNKIPPPLPKNLPHPTPSPFSAFLWTLDAKTQTSTKGSLAQLEERRSHTPLPRQQKSMIRSQIRDILRT